MKFYSGQDQTIMMRINNAFTMFYFGFKYSWTYRQGKFGMPSALLNETHEKLCSQESKVEVKHD